MPTNVIMECGCKHIGKEYVANTRVSQPYNMVRYIFVAQSAHFPSTLYSPVVLNSGNIVQKLIMVISF